MSFKKIIYLSPAENDLASISKEVASEYDLERNRGNYPALLILNNDSQFVLGMQGTRKLESQIKQALAEKRYHGVSLRLELIGGSLRDHLKTLTLRGYSTEDLSQIDHKSNYLIGYSFKYRKR